MRAMKIREYKYSNLRYRILSARRGQGDESSVFLIGPLRSGGGDLVKDGPRAGSWRRIDILVVELCFKLFLGHYTRQRSVLYEAWVVSHYLDEMRDMNGRLAHRVREPRVSSGLLPESWTSGRIFAHQKAREQRGRSQNAAGHSRNST